MIQWILIVLGVLAGALVLLLIVLVTGMRSKSTLVQGAVKRFNRRFMNPRQLKTAGTPGAYAGIVRHRGRRSGRLYETPIGPFATDDGFVIALPYGAGTDWVRNVLAAGSATLVTEGHEYAVGEPEVVSIAEVLDMLPRGERRNLSLFRVEHALRVHRGGAADAR